MTIRSRKLAYVIIFCFDLFGAQASAEFMPVGQRKNIFIDTESVVPLKGYVQFSLIENESKERGIRIVKNERFAIGSYWSIKTTYIYHCLSAKKGELYKIYYSEKDGAGEIVSKKSDLSTSFSNILSMDELSAYLNSRCKSVNVGKEESTKATVEIPPKMTIDLAAIKPGNLKMFGWGNHLIVVYHRTADDIAKLKHGKTRSHQDYENKMFPLQAFGHQEKPMYSHPVSIGSNPFRSINERYLVVWDPWPCKPELRIKDGITTLREICRNTEFDLAGRTLNSRSTNLGVPPHEFASKKHLVLGTESGIAEGTKFSDPIHFDRLDPDYALIRASIVNNAAEVSVAINRGANVNFSKISDESPLGVAVFHKSYDAMMALLKNKADPNIPNKRGQLPLNLALMTADFQAANVLVDFGANVKPTCSDRRCTETVVCESIIDDQHIAVLAWLKTKGFALDFPVYDGTVTARDCVNQYDPILRDAILLMYGQ